MQSLKYFHDSPYMIAESRDTEAPRYGMTADGYTRRSGAPTTRMIRLAHERRWRRVMVRQFSNAGTLFVKIFGEEFILTGAEFPSGT